MKVVFIRFLVFSLFSPDRLAYRAPESVVTKMKERPKQMKKVNTNKSQLG
jgi:hypothetical protein